MGAPDRNPSKGTEQIPKTMIANLKGGLKLHTGRTHYIPENTDAEKLTPDIFGENI